MASTSDTDSLEIASTSDTYSITFSIKEEILKILPKISGSVVDNLCSAIQEAGVEEVSQLRHLQEQDFVHHCNKITARMLLSRWQEPLSSELKATSTTSTTATTATVISDVINEKKFSMEDYNIPVDLFGKKLNETIRTCEEEGKRLPILARRTMVRCVADDLHRRIQKPGRKILRDISKLLITQFPSLNETLEDQITLGNGHSALLSNLEHRFDNLNRNSVYEKKTPEKMISVKTKKKDAYGCYNYSPIISEHEKDRQKKVTEELKFAFKQSSEATKVICDKMKTCYDHQRHVILEMKEIELIRVEFPFLFKKVCFNDHFSNLTGVGISNVLDTLEKKNRRIVNFIERRSKTKLTALKQKGVTLLHHLTQFFGEAEESLFMMTDCTSHESLADLQVLPLNPCIVIAENGANWLAIDRSMAFSIDLDLEGIFLLVASYFIFSIQYPIEIGSTLEFLQRYIFKINPEKGSKIQFTAGKKRHCSINPKVLNLITALSTEESLRGHEEMDL